MEGLTHFVYDDKELAELTKKDEEAQYIEIFETEEIVEIADLVSDIQVIKHPFKNGVRAQLGVEM